MAMEAYAMKKRRIRRWKPFLKDFEIRAQLRMEKGFLKIGDFEFFLHGMTILPLRPPFKKTHKTKGKHMNFLH